MTGSRVLYLVMAAMALRDLVLLRRPSPSGPHPYPAGGAAVGPSSGGPGRARRGPATGSPGSGGVAGVRPVRRGQPVASAMASEATSSVWPSSASPWAMDGNATS